MITPAFSAILLALVGFAPALQGSTEAGPRPVAQQPKSGASIPKEDPKHLTFTGRIVDGLGRPLSGVKVTVTSLRPNAEKHAQSVVLTGDDGRYSAGIAREDEGASLAFEKDGYRYTYVSGTNLRHEEITLYRNTRWEEIPLLPYRNASAFDEGVRELFAPEEWNREPEGKYGLLGFLFKHQDQFRPALRRVAQDARVGASVRDWLDLLGDPGDRDLLPDGRRFAPKHEVKETDLVEAIKATARHYNFFNPKPEPMITVDVIALTKDMDRAMIECGINRATLTGFTRRFVFQKVGKQWVLRGAAVVDRS